MANSHQISDGTVPIDGTVIIDRGRGPAIAGTRITIYTVRDFLGDGIPGRS